MAFSGPTFIVTGLNAFTADLLGSAAAVGGKALDATRESAEEIRDAQRAVVPVLEGTTRRSVSYETGVRDGEITASIGASHFVARFLQFGTVKMSPKMDIIAASQPGVDRWMDRMAEIAADV